MKNLIVKVIFCSLIFLNYQGKTQITILDTNNISYFKDYNIFFLGEEHEINSNDNIQTQIISMLKTNKTKVLLEVGYDRNYAFEKFFIEKDTINYKFFSKENNKYNSKLFNLLFKIKIVPKAIDVATKETFIKEFVTETYARKTINSQEVKNDILEFSEIGMVKFPNEIKNMNRIDRFIPNFKKNIILHKDCLGNDSTKIEEYFESLNAMVLSRCDSSTKAQSVISNFREEFMFKMIKKEIINDPESRIFSINGFAHANLNSSDPLALKKKKDWISLANRVKNYFPKKRICSILLLDRNKHKVFAKEFSEELKYILKNTQAGKTYLINLNYEDTPFKNLIDKYTCIIVS